MVNRQPRYPNIEWYCDRCHAHLNTQTGFDDHHYIWKCTKCGYKSSISRANITFSTTPSRAVNVLGKALGVLRTIVVYMGIVALLGLFVFKTKLMLLRLLPIVGIAYLVLDIFSMFFEKVIIKYGKEEKLFKWIISSFPIYLLGDLIRIIKEPIQMVKTIVSYSFSKKKWQYNLLESIMIGLTYSIVLMVFIFAVLWLSNESMSNTFA